MPHRIAHRNEVFEDIPNDKFLKKNSSGQIEGADVGAGGPHATTHQNNGDDEISVAGLSGQLADAQPSTPALAGAEAAGTVAIHAAFPNAHHSAFTQTNHDALPNPHHSNSLDHNGGTQDTAIAGKEPANSNIQTHVTGTGSPHTAAGVGALATTAFSGLAKITVGTGQPGTPSVGDLWVDTN